MKYYEPNSRRIIKWDLMKGARAKIAIAIGTSGGAGLFPFAPGTAGTIVGMPIHYFSQGWDPVARLAIWAFLTFIGTWAWLACGLMACIGSQVSTLAVLLSGLRLSCAERTSAGSGPGRRKFPSRM